MATVTRMHLRCNIHTKGDRQKEEVFWKHFYSAQDVALTVSRLRRVGDIVEVEWVRDEPLRGEALQLFLEGYPDWCHWHFETEGENTSSFADKAVEQVRRLQRESTDERPIGQSDVRSDFVVPVRVKKRKLQ